MATLQNFKIVLNILSWFNNHLLHFTYRPFKMKRHFFFHWSSEDLNETCVQNEWTVMIDVCLHDCVFQVYNRLLPPAVLPQVLQRRPALLPQVSPSSTLGEEEMLLTPAKRSRHWWRKKTEHNPLQTSQHHLVDVIMFEHEISWWTLRHTLAHNVLLLSLFEFCNILLQNTTSVFLATSHFFLTSDVSKFRGFNLHVLRSRSSRFCYVQCSCLARNKRKNVSQTRDFNVVIKIGYRVVIKSQEKKNFFFAIFSPIYQPKFLQSIHIKSL